MNYFATKRIFASSSANKKFVTATAIACFGGGVAYNNLHQENIQSSSTTTICEQSQQHNDHLSGNSNDAKNNDTHFFDYFPKKQLFQPKRPYPAWDDNWDGKNELQKQVEDRGENRNAVTRHIILVRHGQYDETSEDDSKRNLTDLGRQQAHLTGRRMAEMIHGISNNKKNNGNDADNENYEFDPCNVNVIRVSDMTRAKETASIISQYLPQAVIRHDPDPLLNEGIPAQIIPKRPELDIDDDLAENGARIEEGFKKYFYRKTNQPDENKNTKGWFFMRNSDRKGESSSSSNDEVDADKGSNSNNTMSTSTPTKEKQDKHEFEIIVCHGNVIRYFFCRALQLPPEAWLRLSIFNCSLTYLIVKPNGRVSCRMLGDIGHLGYGHSTFSMNHGFVW